MTCIVALRDSSGLVTLAGDSGTFVGWNVTDKPDGKVWKSGEMLLGVSGTSRGSAILRYSFVPPAIPTDMPLITYMNTLFVNEMRDKCRAGGFLKVESGVDGLGICLLVGLKGRIFWMDNYFDISEVSTHYHSIGCGAEYAMGALGLAVQLYPDDIQKELAETAIRIAMLHNTGVHGEITMVSEGD